MLFQTLIFWLLFLLNLVPLLITGIIVLRKTTSLARIELILPVGSVLGLTIFTFFLNSLAFLIKGPTVVITAYLSTICLGLFVHKFIKSRDDRIEFLHGRDLVLWFLSILGWGGLIFWKAAHALIGSDTNLYYSVAHSFIRGNFPPLTPWQPDLPLAYHLGASELLGAFYLFTNLNFQFLHLFLSAFFILCAVQIVIWIWDRHKHFFSLLIANLVAVMIFISFGFFYLIIPNFSINLPKINNVHELVLWLRDLPTVNQAIEVYGAPINLDGLIYFIFHAFGIAIFLSLVTMLIYYKKDNSLVTWTFLSVGLLTLALVNESIFVAAVLAVLVGILLTEKGNLFKKPIQYLLLGTVTILTILFQGGIITSAIFPTKSIEKSIIAFPQKQDLKENFTEYHYNQEISKMLPTKLEWGGLLWFHVGVDLLMLVDILLLLKLKVEPRQFILLITLFIAGFTSLIGYNILVPKFLVANGNRFLSFSFLTFSLVICLFLIQIVKSLKEYETLKKVFVTAFILWLFIPTVFPPLALLSKTRFGKNMMVLKPQASNEAVEWIKKNLPYSSKVIVLDSRTPHPSGMARALIEAGVFAPIFPGQFRAYTIEASPEYFDIAYFLSPSAMQKLKADILLVDNDFFETLPEIRKKQLNDSEYFTKIFDTRREKIYRVKQEYLANGSEMEGTFEQMINVVPKKGKIYIDNEENFNPSYLRRALIFSLRDKDLYYLPQSGVYLNVEADINSHELKENKKYDFLVLSKITNPLDVCQCRTDLIWKGMKEEIYLWQTKY